MLETVFERSGAGILVRNSFRGGSVREGVEFSRALRAVLRRKACIGKGGELGTPQGVSDKGEDIYRRSEGKQSEWTVHQQ